MILRLLAVALAASAVLQPQTPIRSGVDLLRINVTALDDNGQPVRDLRSHDFVVTVDGKPRTVSFAKFYGPDAERRITPPATPVTFATNTGTAPGRVVILVVDIESMHPGYEKLILDTAGAMIDRLGPTDSVGLLILPGTGVELTREHSRVRRALEKLRGFGPSRRFQQRVVSVAEAEGFQRGDIRVKAEVIGRECEPLWRSELSAAAAGRRVCPQEVEQEARLVLNEADRRIRTVVSTMTALNTRLKSVEAPKTIVLLSAGLPFRLDTIGRFRDLQREAAEAGTTTYVVQLDQPLTDAAGRTDRGANVVKEDLHDGLSTLAQVTEGTLSAGVGTARGVFDRIHTEIVHSYQLGVESLPSDADGKSHQVDVKVRREGITVRSRREIIVPTRERRAMTSVEVLSQPTDLAEAPMAAAAYTTRGDDATTLKVVVLVELLSSATTSTPPSYAFAVMKDDKAIFQTADNMVIVPGGARAVVGAQLTPGDYRLRVAAVDGAGRPGSVDLPLQVALRQAGPLQFSNLLVGTNSEQFAPVTHFEVGATASALLELYAADPAHLENVTVNFEVRRAGDDAVMALAPAVVHTTTQARRRVADGRMPIISALAAGTYVVSATVYRPNEPGARISSTIVIRPNPLPKNE